MSVRLNRTMGVSLTREDEHKMMIVQQLNRVVEYLECSVTVVNMSNIEGDDVIGYSTFKHIFTKSKNTILSTDKDFLQLVDENIRVYSPTKKENV